MAFGVNPPEDRLSDMRRTPGAALSSSALTRRALLGVFPALLVRNVAARSDPPQKRRFVLPMSLPGGIPGEGCYIRHGYACENTSFNSGWWHTGENWYVIEGNSAGALIHAVAAGEVVYAASDYPGRVVIVRHEDELYSMYGHLDYELAVVVGDVVELGQVLGTVLFRTDSRSPSHLHFEMRTFFTTPMVNGSSPRYNYPCGVQCPPGPGYWPMADPDHPSTLGWLNPMHVIARSAYPEGVPAGEQVVVASNPAIHSAAILSAPDQGASAEAIDQLILIPGQRFPLLNISAGDAATVETSAGAYEVWYEVEALNGVRGWVRAYEPSPETTGADGRASALRINFLMTSTQI